MFLNKKSKYSAVITISFFLFACGGGGGEDSTPQTTDATAVIQSSASEETTLLSDNTAVTADSSEEVITRAADLSVPAGFDFSTGYRMEFTVSLAERNSERVFITLCPEYAQTATGFDVDYESCILKVSVTDGYFSESLSVTNDKQELLAILWFFDGSDPLYVPWVKDSSDQDLQQFNISY